MRVLVQVPKFAGGFGSPAIAWIWAQLFASEAFTYMISPLEHVGYILASSSLEGRPDVWRVCVLIPSKFRSVKKGSGVAYRKNKQAKKPTLLNDLLDRIWLAVMDFPDG